MTHLQPGQPAPTFSLLNQDNQVVDLRDFLGRFVVIYFYPKASTSGCTQQACALRDNWSKLSQFGISVLGISPDNTQKLRKFKDMENLPFDLLSDSEHVAANLYETWVEKSMYGRKYMGMSRDSFLIGPNQHIIAVLRKVQPGRHVEHIFEAFSLYKSQNNTGI